MTIKEQSAIELKYLGKTYPEIGEALDIPQDTLRGWFESNGKLFVYYQDYVKEMTEKRKKNFEEKLFELDDNVAVQTTNVMRQFMKDLEKKKLSMSDYKNAWEIQRTMQGLPTDVKKQDMTFDQKELDEENEKIKELLGKKNNDIRGTNITNDKSEVQE